MTEQEYKDLNANETILRPISEGVETKYKYLGMYEDGTHRLEGRFFGHSTYIIKNYFEVVK